MNKDTTAVIAEETLPEFIEIVVEDASEPVMTDSVADISNKSEQGHVSIDAEEEMKKTEADCDQVPAEINVRKRKAEELKDRESGVSPARKMVKDDADDDMAQSQSQPTSTAMDNNASEPQQPGRTELLSRPTPHPAKVEVDSDLEVFFDAEQVQEQFVATPRPGGIIAWFKARFTQPGGRFGGFCCY